MIKKIGIIGLGSIGKRHFDVISQYFPYIEVVIVSSKKKIEYTTKNVILVRTIEEAITLDIQAAIIASPASFHIDQAIQLAKEGIHLLIEKPLACADSTQIKALKKIAYDSKLVLLVGYTLRYDPNLMKLKQLIDSKVYGDILSVHIECGSYLPDWRPDQDYTNTVSAKKELGGGVLLELSHELHYAKWIFDLTEIISAITRNSNTLNINVEDHAVILAQSKEGYPIQINIDFCRKESKRLCRVVTINGELHCNLLKKEITFEENNKVVTIKANNYERNDIFLKQFKHFIKCVEGVEIPKVTIDDGINILRMISLCKNQTYE
ncbi:MAG: Gfo/Idh/MocA family oxidoreductase [bacterium]